MSQISDIIQHLSFLPDISLITIFSRSIYIAANGSISFCLWLSNIPLHINATSLSSNQLKDPLVASVSWLLKIVPL